MASWHHRAAATAQLRVTDRCPPFRLRRAVALRDEAPLFVRISRCAHEDPVALSAVAVYRVVSHANAGGIPARLAHPHALRAYWATRCPKPAVPVYDVSAPLDHVDLLAPLRATLPGAPSRSTRSRTCSIAATRPRDDPVAAEQAPAAARFPRWRRLAAVRWQAQADLLSLPGVFVTAVLLALANEISPGTNAGVWMRIVHGVLVVLVALIALTGGAALTRAVLYCATRQHRWELAGNVTHGVARVVVRSRRAEDEPLEWSNLCVLRPDGELLESPSTPYMLDGGSADSEPGDLEIGFPILQPGVYELRLYGTRRLYELARWTLDVTAEAITCR